MKPGIIATGDRYGRLVVVREVERTSRYCRRFECACDCGTVKQYNLTNLRQGTTSSCGCLCIEMCSAINFSHGESHSVEERVLRGMINRCHNPNEPAYYRYGGRGIAVCNEWRKNPAAFIAHVGRRPTPTHQIERVDNDGNYEPGNVRWATSKEQNRNRRNNLLVDYNGRRVLVLDACRQAGISYGTVRDRISRGWSESSLFLPVRGLNRKVSSAK